MLVLTRKPHQKIMIGDDISVNVVDVQGDNVRIAIDAPRHIKIYRGEIYEVIQTENRAAASPSTLAFVLTSSMPKKPEADKPKE